MTAGLRESDVMIVAAVCEVFHTSSSSSQIVAPRLPPLTSQVSWSSWIDELFSLSLQEKGIPLMGESSFLASWFNRCAVMMGMFIYVCLCVCYYLAVGAALFPLSPATLGMFFPTILFQHLGLT